jgi:hypothetical protein
MSRWPPALVARAPEDCALRCQSSSRVSLWRAKTADRRRRRTKIRQTDRSGSERTAHDLIMSFMLSIMNELQSIGYMFLCALCSKHGRLLRLLTPSSTDQSPLCSLICTPAAYHIPVCTFLLFSSPLGPLHSPNASCPAAALALKFKLHSNLWQDRPSQWPLLTQPSSHHSPMDEGRVDERKGTGWWRNEGTA